MTILQILKTLQRAGKKVQRCQIYRYLSALKIQSSGNARPAIYPPDTATRILNHLGLTTFAQSNGMDWAAKLVTGTTADGKEVTAILTPARSRKIHSLGKLKSLKRKGGK